MFEMISVLSNVDVLSALSNGDVLSVLCNVDKVPKNCDIELIVRVLVASGCGFTIGSERNIRRSHVLPYILEVNTILCVTVAVFVAGSLLYSPQDASPSRVAGQVISGMGFLGSSVILVSTAVERIQKDFTPESTISEIVTSVKKGSIVSGLTTAVVLWFTTAVGILAGLGAFIAALITTGFYFVLMGFLPELRKWIKGEKDEEDEEDEEDEKDE